MNQNNRVGPYCVVKCDLPDNAVLTGNGIVESLSDVRVYGPGPSGAYTTAHRDAQLGVRVNSRCFTGTVAQFRARLDRDPSVTLEQRATALEFIAKIEADFGL